MDLKDAEPTTEPKFCSFLGTYWRLALAIFGYQKPVVEVISMLTNCSQIM